MSPEPTTNGDLAEEDGDYYSPPCSCGCNWVDFDVLWFEE